MLTKYGICKKMFEGLGQPESARHPLLREWSLSIKPYNGLSLSSFKYLLCISLAHVLTATCLPLLRGGGTCCSCAPARNCGVKVLAEDAEIHHLAPCVQQVRHRCPCNLIYIHLIQTKRTLIGHNSLHSKNLKEP